MPDRLAKGYDSSMLNDFEAGVTVSEKKKPNGVSEFFDWADSVVISVFCIILVFTFALRLVGVKGESMKDTLQNNDRLFITNLFYTPKDGDIVVISRSYLYEPTEDQAEPIIKRVIATEGQTVNFFKNDDGHYSVSVDDVLLDEDYIREPMNKYYDKTVSFPYTVEKGHVFVMGDNRNDSHDSRSPDIGAVDIRYILGKAVFRILPIDTFGTLY